VSPWFATLMGLALIAGLIIVTRRWGKSSARITVLEDKIDGAITRKAIDAKVQRLTSDELADRLRNGL